MNLKLLFIILLILMCIPNMIGTSTTFNVDDLSEFKLTDEEIIEKIQQALMDNDHLPKIIASENIDSKNVLTGPYVYADAPPKGIHDYSIEIFEYLKYSMNILDTHFVSLNGLLINFKENTMATYIHCSNTNTIYILQLKAHRREKWHNHLQGINIPDDQDLLRPCREALEERFGQGSYKLDTNVYLFVDPNQYEQSRQFAQNFRYQKPSGLLSHLQGGDVLANYKWMQTLKQLSEQELTLIDSFQI